MKGLPQWRERISPIGLDVRSQAIHAVQVTTQPDGSRTLRSAASVPRLEPGSELSVAEAARALAVLDRRGFEGRRLVVTPPDRGVLSALLELPPVGSGAPVGQIAAAEMARTIKREPGTFEMAYWVVPSPPRGSEGVHAMAVAASHSTSMELLSVLDQAGADVVAIDVRAWALARACSPNPWRLTGVVELGWASGRLVVLHEGSVVYERILEEWSLRALYEAMANVLETDVANVRALLDAPEFVDVPKDRRAGGDPLAAARRALLASIEALAKEIGVSFRYIEHRFANEVGPGEVGGVHVCGPGASLPGLVKELAERIGVRTSQASPSTLIRFPTEGIDGPAGIGRGSDLVVALGLAMWKEVGA